MCRNLTNRIRAIEAAKATTPHIIEVYDTYDDGTDLVAIIEVIHETTARVMEVNRMGELEHFKDVRVFDIDDLTNRRVAALVGSDPRFIRIHDNVA